MNVVIAGVAAILLIGCDGAPQSVDTTFVQSSDPELREAVARLLPGIARRSGLELSEPVRVERRSRADLERYLVAKLEEELTPLEEEHLTRVYALLGMVPPDLDLRALLLSVYTEQVAGFYDPDSTALFLMEDQPVESQVSLLVHELVHAVQDQAHDLDALTARSLGNDRRAAAQAAIEGHATLIMIEHTMEQRQPGEVDLSTLPNMSAQLRPILESVRTQYPALAGAPRVIQQSVLFPYVEGTSFVQALWSSEVGRVPPFGDHLPTSTEQVMRPTRFVRDRDEPTGLSIEVENGPVVFENSLGELETAILRRELTGADDDSGAAGWDGDRYVLVQRGEEYSLAWASVWDDAGARDSFAADIRPQLGRLPVRAALTTEEWEGRPGMILEVGDVGATSVRLSQEPPPSP